MVDTELDGRDMHRRGIRIAGQLAADEQAQDRELASLRAQVASSTDMLITQRIGELLSIAHPADVPHRTYAFDDPNCPFQDEDILLRIVPQGYGVEMVYACFPEEGNKGYGGVFDHDSSKGFYVANTTWVRTAIKELGPKGIQVHDSDLSPSELELDAHVFFTPSGKHAIFLPSADLIARIAERG